MLKATPAKELELPSGPGQLNEGTNIMTPLNTLRTVLLILVLVAGASTTPALTPGPTIILECPGCKQGLREFSIGSGNTIGAKWWTDGKMDAPMMPLRHALRKCPHCRELFWSADAKKLAEFRVYEDKAE